nr:acyltransferase [Agreia pratensis]
MTGLRWLAALVVFAYHVRNAGLFSGNAQSAMTSVFGAGAIGVSLFFVLSGFVLSWSHKPNQSARSFWWHRVARIYPLHVVALAAALLLSATVLPQIATGDPWALFANATLTSSWNADWWQAGNPVSWSLVCEAFFYLAFPLIIVGVRALSRRALISAAVSTVILVLATSPIVSALLPQISPNSSPIVRLPEFVLGVVLAQLMAKKIWRGPRLVPALAVAIAGYAAAQSFPDSPLRIASFTIVGFCLLIAALARADQEGRPTILATKPLTTLGTLSFPFYLVHLLIIQSFVALVPGAYENPSAVVSIVHVIGALAIALVAAALLHRLVENPGRRLLLSRMRPSRTVDPSPVRHPDPSRREQASEVPVG